jgi:hypothetical protein
MRKRNKILLLILLILGLGIGFAYVNGLLKINGTALVKRASWDIHFDNIQVTTGSVTPTSAATITSGNPTEVTYAIDLDAPGDFYEFTVDVVNNGSMDAMISEVTFENKAKEVSSWSISDATFPDHINASVKFSDGLDLAPGYVLAAHTSDTYKVRIEFRDDLQASDLEGISKYELNLKFEVVFGQADDTAVSKPVAFATDSWDTIAAAGNAAAKQKSTTGTCGEYAVGDTKTVSMDLDNNGTNENYSVRIANCSTPAVCNDSSFSQTACGFVVEFVDVIGTHRMNANGLGEGYKSGGGWQYSDMRAYLNDTIYAAEDIDYSTTGLLNKLPDDLKKVLAKTKVVSGYGVTDNYNFETIDKLYLLSTHEIWEDSDGSSNDGIDYYDSAYSNTRQLDYYNGEESTTTSYSAAIKTRNNNAYNWWLRSPGTNSDGFFIVMPQGYPYYYGYAPENNGVSPAFKLK